MLASQVHETASVYKDENWKTPGGDVFYPDRCQLAVATLGGRPSPRALSPALGLALSKPWLQLAVFWNRGLYSKEKSFSNSGLLMSLGRWLTGITSRPITAGQITILQSSGLEEVYLPQMQPEDESDARLIILDGHRSHVSVRTCLFRTFWTKNIANS